MDNGVISIIQESALIDQFYENQKWFKKLVEILVRKCEQSMVPSIHAFFLTYASQKYIS